MVRNTRVRRMPIDNRPPPTNYPHSVRGGDAPTQRQVEKFSRLLESKDEEPSQHGNTEANRQGWSRDSDRKGLNGRRNDSAVEPCPVGGEGDAVADRVASGRQNRLAGRGRGYSTRDARDRTDKEHQRARRNAGTPQRPQVCDGNEDVPCSAGQHAPLHAQPGSGGDVAELLQRMCLQAGFSKSRADQSRMVFSLAEGSPISTVEMLRDAGQLHVWLYARNDEAFRLMHARRSDLLVDLRAGTTLYVSIEIRRDDGLEGG